MLPDYDNTVDELEKRIFDLIPTNLQILEFTSPWYLLDIRSFHFGDLSPSVMQMAVALGKAQNRYKEYLK
jgi:hypothetical protein